MCVQRLRCEAGSRLVQLDSLTRRNRTLTRLFQGAMKARLLASARECGQRWDDVNAKLESITGRLKVRNPHKNYFFNNHFYFIAEKKKNSVDEFSCWLICICIFFSQLFVSEWEEFETEREELSLWLADLDVRLTEVDHLTGNTCEKLRRLQVCVI